MHVCFTPKKQTSSTAIMTSALCEKRTHAVQQAAGYEMILSALASSDSGTCITPPLHCICGKPDHADDEARVGELKRLGRVFAETLLAAQAALNILFGRPQLPGTAGTLQSAQSHPAALSVALRADHTRHRAMRERLRCAAVAIYRARDNRAEAARVGSKP
jgi:hypothetical protein